MFRKSVSTSRSDPIYISLLFTAAFIYLFAKVGGGGKGEDIEGRLWEGKGRCGRGRVGLRREEGPREIGKVVGVGLEKQGEEWERSRRRKRVMGKG